MIYSSACESINSTGDYSSVNVTAEMSINQTAGRIEEEPFNIPKLWPMSASDYLDWIFPPIALILANVCNVLGILVLSRPSLRSTSIGVYLLILAITDIIYLNSYSLVAYVEFMTNYTVNLACWLKCKLHLTLLGLFSHLASWIIVAVTIDRLIAISIPLHASLYCTPKRALKVCSGLFVIFLLIDGKEIFTVTGRYFIPGTTQFIYTFNNNFYATFWTKYGIWVMTLLNHVTFPLLLILNIILIYFLRKIITIRQDITEKEQPRNKTGTKNKDIKVRVKSKEVQFTKVLLFVSTSSVLMNIPFACLVLMLMGGFWKSEEHTLFENVLIWFLYKLFFAIATTHRASYFFMYCVTGEKFRGELKHLFFRSRPAAGNTSAISMSDITRVSSLDR